MADCKFRMVERPCHWAECDALLNSGENLYLHLKLHTQETSSKVSGYRLLAWSGSSLNIQRGSTYAIGSIVLGDSSRRRLW